MITVQPIRSTSRPQRWHRFATALGLAPAFAPAPGWSEFDGVGVLAVRGVPAGDPLDGRTDLHVRTDDLDGVAARLTGTGVEVLRSTRADVGPSLTATASSGAVLTVSAGARRADRGPLSALPIWYQADLAQPRLVLEAIGLRPRIASTSASWTDYTADGGGLAAVHLDEAVRIELAWEYTGDLDAYAQRLTDGGFPAAVIDEAYNRTVRVISPDGDEVWINGAQDDLYGFTRLDTTS